MDCSPLGSSVLGISQARILDWVAISLSRRSSWPNDWTHISCLAGRFFTTQPPGKPQLSTMSSTNLSSPSIIPFLLLSFALLRLSPRFEMEKSGILLHYLLGINRISRISWVVKTTQEPMLLLKEGMEVGKKAWEWPVGLKVVPAVEGRKVDIELRALWGFCIWI